MTVDYAVVQVPSQLLQPPLHWDPRLAYQLKKLRNEGIVAFLDWALWRIPLEVLILDIQQYEPMKTILWCPDYEALPYALKLQKRVGGVIMGLPQRDDLNQEKWSHKPGYMDLDLFERDRYYENSALPYGLDSAQWKQRIPLQFRLGATPGYKLCAKVITNLKIKWWFDSATWLDNVTEDTVWTLKLLHTLEKNDVSFQFSCRASYNRIDQYLINRLRDHGCRAIDFGEIPTNIFEDQGEKERLEGALMACRKSEVTGVLRYVIDENSTFTNCRDAVKFSKQYDFVHLPKVDIPYEKLSIDEILEVSAERFWNPTSWSDLELLGTIRAMEQGLTKAI